jgi:hypothetical protein
MLTRWCGVEVRKSERKRFRVYRWRLVWPASELGSASTTKASWAHRTRRAILGSTFSLTSNTTLPSHLVHIRITHSQLQLLVNATIMRLSCYRNIDPFSH